MKHTQALLIALALGTSAFTTVAQDGGNSDARRTRPPQAPPFVKVLDANHDGVLDATEIANASAALLTLDTNGDGQITMDELRPADRRRDGPPQHRRGPEANAGRHQGSPDDEGGTPPAPPARRGHRPPPPPAPDAE